jgi:hypothetical protein
MHLDHLMVGGAEPNGETVTMVRLLIKEPEGLDATSGKWLHHLEREASGGEARRREIRAREIAEIDMRCVHVWLRER